MIRFFRRWRQRRERQADIKFLWPELVWLAQGNLKLARMAFIEHAKTDPSWCALSREDFGKIMATMREWKCHRSG